MAQAALPPIRWAGLGGHLCDHEGRAIPRPFSLSLLPPSLERMLRQPEGEQLLDLLGRSCGLAHRSAIAQLEIALFQEGLLQLVFRVGLRSSRGERHTLGLVLAKEGGAVAERARREAELLHRLGEQCPGCCVEVFGGGQLPRLTRAGGTVPLYFYVSRWLDDFRELAADAGHRFFVNDITLTHHRARLDGEALRESVVRLLARLYDPQRRESPATPEVNSGDLVVRVPPRTPYELLLVAVRGMTSGEAPGQLVARLAGPAGRYEDRPFRLCPADPRRFLAALRAGFVDRLGPPAGERLLGEAVGSWLEMLAGPPAGARQALLPPWFRRHELQAAFTDMR